ncbi:MAG: hypothetical protein IAF08_15160 [Rhizobacter sp.]|nr:hypothetical protein [Chlorobiales bacterium]
MPEYFEVALISGKTGKSKEAMRNCLIEKFGLSEGKGTTKHFAGKNILVCFYEFEGTDFDETEVNFPDQVFHKDDFEKELEDFTSFVNICFESCNEVKFAVCSYELNGYLMSYTKKIEDFDDELLRKFPIVYKRETGQKHPLLMINLDAQGILI